MYGWLYRSTSIYMLLRLHILPLVLHETLPLVHVRPVTRPLQARLPVLLSPSCRAYCGRWLVQKCLAAERSVQDSATCRLCHIIVAVQSMTVHCRPCVLIILH